MYMYQNCVDQNFTSNEQNINFENTKSSQNAWTDAASPAPSVPVSRPGLVPVVTIPASAGPPSQPSPAAANLCSFQSAISKREDLCRTENQYLIFRITLTVRGGLCLAGRAGRLGWGNCWLVPTEGTLHKKVCTAPAPSPAQPSPGEYQQPGCSDWLYRV